jgi:hypothetical protein
MSEFEFTTAVIRTRDKEISVLLSDVVQVRDETAGGAVLWHLELGISRANPDRMDWEELDNLVQGSPELQFRINGKHEFPVDSWFGETGSRVGIRLPDISLGIDLTWHNLEGPVESVEALWVEGECTQELGSLVVRTLGHVPNLAWDEPSQRSGTSGSGCGSAVLIAAGLICGAASVLT